MNKKEVKGLPVREMILCDACSEYHPVEDCEVIVIRIVKGKACKLERQQKNLSFDPPSHKENMHPVEEKKVVPAEDEDLRNFDFSPKPPPRSVVPPQFRDLMSPPPEMRL